MNNACIVKTVDLIDMEYQDWLDVVNVNLFGETIIRIIVIILLFIF
jgi:hypothetical protein